MSLKIYLDDCAFSHRLRQLLVDAGHEIQVPADVDPSLRGAKDEIHFDHALSTNQIILTYNAADFLELHQCNSAHSGIIVVYQDNDPSRDMTYADIVKAIANLLSSGVEIAGCFWVLNLYKW